MPLLEELSRRIIAQLPTFLGGMPEGYAESRLSHGPMQVVPDAQWGQQTKDNPSNVYGYTAQAGPTQRDTVFVPQREFLGNYSGDLQAPSGLPPGSIPRHEAIHQFLGSVDTKLDPSKIIGLLGQNNYNRLTAPTSQGGYGYNPFDAMREVPARLTTDPTSLGMSAGSGQDAMRKYLELLRQTDPSKATRLSKYLGLSGSEKGDGVAELQRPNDTF
jgi:hypothetical protein